MHKTNNESISMKHLLPFVAIFLTSLLLSCEKIDSDLTGSWQLKKTYYLITPNQELTFHNPFGEPWQGEISINETVLDAASFTYYFDNSWPGNLFASEEVSFTFSGPKLLVEYIGGLYELEINSFDIETGIFKAEGTATGIFNTVGQSIQVKIDATMPKMNLKQGEQIQVKDSYFYMPYRKLWLHANGKMKSEFLIGDIMDHLSGRWSAQHNELTLSPEKESTGLYRYSINGNQLQLSRELASDIASLPSNLSPYRDQLEKVIFCADYTRE